VARAWLPLTALLCLASVVHAQPEPSLTELTQQLGSARFAERERAAQALEQIGMPAVPALQQAAAHGDLEVKRRVAALLQRIEQKHLSAGITQPRLVRLQFDGVPLGRVVSELERRTGLQVALDGELPRRVIRVDTGTLPFWQAWTAFCRQAQLRDSAAGHPRLLLGEAEGRSLPAGDDSGVFRVRMWPSGPPGVAVLQVAVQAEPGLPIVSYEELRVTGVEDQAGKKLDVTVRADMSVLPPDAPRPILGASWTGLLTMDGAVPSGVLRAVQGHLRARVEVPRPLVSVADVLQASGKESAGHGGLRLKVLHAALTGDGDISVHLRLDGLSALPPVEQKFVRVRPGVVAIRGPADVALDFIELLDGVGRKVPCIQATASTIDGQADCRLTFQPRPGFERELRLVVGERRVVTVEVPFAVKELRLP
jgi:hypothetical protein